MSPEANPIVVANAKLAATAEVTQELVRSRAELSLALGQLVGSRIVAEGYPSWATYNQTPDPKSGRPRIGSGPIYGAYRSSDELRPIACQGEVLATGHDFVEIGLEPPQTGAGSVVSYTIKVANLLSLKPVETKPE